MGQYYWRYLLEDKKNRKARKWLKDTLRMANEDKYAWCIALAHINKAKYLHYISEPFLKAEDAEYKKALEIALQHNFASLMSIAKNSNKERPVSHLA